MHNFPAYGLPFTQRNLLYNIKYSFMKSTYLNCKDYIKHVWKAWFAMQLFLISYEKNSKVDIFQK